MALEAVVFQQDSYSYGCSDIHLLGGGEPWSPSLSLQEEKASLETTYCSLEQGFITHLEPYPSSMVQAGVQEQGTNTSFDQRCTSNRLSAPGLSVLEAPAATMGGRKRLCTRRTRNREQKENQRITHIAVERNRRKQMNDYLAALKSMMPASYVKKGDQASVVGGTINFVKELEQLLQRLEAKKRIEQQPDASLTSVFSGFFNFPQFSTCYGESRESVGEKHSAIADIKVTMVTRHANIKISSKKYPKQLLRIVVGLHSLDLIILHLNVTTIDTVVLYSFCVEVEDNSQLTSGNEIAAAVHEMVGRIQLEAQFT